MPSSDPPRGTAPRRDEKPEPRLPHERDESADSQAPQPSGPQADVARRAHDDLAEGQVDTGRKPAADAAYEKQKGNGVPGTKPADPDRSGVPAPRKQR